MIPRLCMRSLFQSINESRPMHNTLINSLHRNSPIERNFSGTPVPSAKAKGSRRRKKTTKYRDPYALKQFELRKSAAIARQELHASRRAESRGDPIRGATEDTEFVKSFAIRVPKKEGGQTEDSEPQPQIKTQEVKTATDDTDRGMSDIGNSDENPTLSESKAVASFPLLPPQLNHFVTRGILSGALVRSKELTVPDISPDRFAADPAEEQKKQETHEKRHEQRAEALSRILAFDNASQEQRTRITIQRCIEKFGRHITDPQLEPRRTKEGQDYEFERLGQDTGSSEVQIAILTAKIRVLLAEFEGRSKNDKMNKRNLRLLLHKRQRLLKYFQKKDRGGERWQHLVKTLGLTSATWEGEISVQ